MREAGNSAVPPPDPLENFIGRLQGIRRAMTAQPGSHTLLGADHLAAINNETLLTPIVRGGQQRVLFRASSAAGPAVDHPERCQVEMDESALTICLPPGTSAARAFSAALRSPSPVAVAAAARMFNGCRMSFAWDYGDLSTGRAVAFSSGDKRKLLIPDHEFFNSGAYAHAKRAIAADALPWHARRTSVFWRGSTTGARRKAAPGPLTAEDWGWLPRLDLCHRCRRSQHAARLNVGISAICQIAEPELVAAVQSSGFMRAPAARATFMAHKWNLVIDGNSNAWSGLFLALCSGVCVIVVESPHRYQQWYYDRLTPWVHFVPVKADLSDLDMIVDWCLTHESESVAIAASGQAFAMGLTVEKEVSQCGVDLAQWLDRSTP